MFYKFLIKLVINHDLSKCYLKLVKQKKVNLLNDIRNSIYYSSKLIDEKNFNNLITHQFLISKLVFNNFLFNSLCIKSYIKKTQLIYPLPRAYLKVIQEHNIKINFICSFILYEIYCILLTVINLIKTIKLFVIKKESLEHKITIFFGLNDSNISFNSKFKGGVINWAERNFNIKEKILINQKIKIKKKVKNKYLIADFTRFFKLDLKDTLVSFSIFFKMILLLPFEFFNEKKFYSFFSYELMEFEFIKRSRITKYINSVFYHHSAVLNSYIYRPYWTYFFDGKINFYLYFYSISFDNLYTLENKIDNYLPLGLTRWPNIVSWNKDNEKFFKRKINNKINLITKEPVSFISSNKKINAKNGIYVFDVYPSELKYFYAAGHNSTNPKQTNAIKFLRDLIRVSEQLNVSIFIKNKREYNNIYSYKYYSFLKNMINEKKIKSIPHNISYEELFQNKNMLCVCRPFTSIAQISKNYKIKTIYYDCTKKLIKNTEAQGQVKLISGYNNLFNYIKNNHES